MRSGPAEHGLILSITSEDETLDPDERARVSLRLSNVSGSEVMSLHIPNHMLDHFATTQQNFKLVMNIEGLVACSGNEQELTGAMPHGIKIDGLVVRAVSPDMLEDEPNALRLLATFKEHLERPLEWVDEAIASLQ